jgi:hypothetical protein
MRLLLCLLQILFLMWVSLIEHYWVILRERRRVMHLFCPLTDAGRANFCTLTPKKNLDSSLYFEE